MLIIGLTGSIAMGKTTVASFFEQQGVPAISADKIVHDLYSSRAAPLIEAKFKGTVKAGVVDRTLLMQALNEGDDERKISNFKALEEIIHPLVREEEWQFLKKAKSRGAKMALIDIPLLFETGSEQMMDVTVLVSAPADVQRRRALERPGMTNEIFDTLSKKQLDDKIKREKADFVVDTGCSLEETERAVARLIERLKSFDATQYANWQESQGD